MTLRTLSIACCLLLPVAALADEDDEGCKDHPQIPRFPRTYISECSINDFAAFDFVVGQDEKTARKEGRYWHIEYRANGDEKRYSQLEVIRNYENAVRRLGGRIVYREADNRATYAMPIGKSERWFQIGFMNGGYNIIFDIIEVAAMQQKVEISAAEMLSALNKDGFVALNGILFDTGKDTIKPESEPLLAEIATLMKSNRGLKISIEGHTDNVGQPKANKQLSEKRAESVKKWLVKNGIEAGRVSTKGWGDTKPVADNRTEEGRSKNRRVELVKR